MNYSQINANTSSNEVLYNISKWHNETPRLWIVAYQPTEEDIQETITQMKANDCYIGIAEDDTLKGFIWAEKQEDDVMIMSLFVDESVRESHVGRSLKEALENWCRSEGIQKIKTTVHSKNRKMISLNEKLGYDSKMLHMEKRLNN